VAQIFGPAGGAQLADQYGFSLLWWLVGGTCLLGALAFRKLQ
jgi:hypothetical protein